jgi:polysaccharide biosynthesis transport protein
MNEVSSDMQRQAVDWWQVIKNRLGTILLTFLLTFAVAAIITYIMPRKFRGRVEMKIERKPEVIQIDDRNIGSNNLMAASENYIKTEFETITKADTLYPVIEQFDLANRWGYTSRLDALHKLLGNLDPLAAVRSDFVVLEYYDEDPKLAAEVANAIADSYMKLRIEKASGHSNAALKAMEEKISELEQQALEARGKMLALQKEGGIIDPGAGMRAARAPGATVGNEAATLSIARENELYKLEAEILTLRAEVQSLDGLAGGQLIEQASAKNQTIAVLYPQYLKLVADREDLTSSGLGTKHPTVKGIDNKIATLRQQVETEAQRHLQGLRTSLAASEQRRGELKDLNDKTKAAAIDQQGGSLAYLTAQRNVEELDELLIKLKTQYYTSTTNEEISKAPATVWQRAEIESAPTKPRVALNLAVGGIVGLLFGLGLAFAIEFMDTTVKSIDDVERYLGIPVLAVVPKGVGVLHQSNGLSPDAEAYRILRTNLEFNRKHASANCLSVVSGTAGEGKSTTISNLAFVCAQGGYNVLLIDADLRRPRQHTLFNTTNAMGLSTYLASDVPLQEVVLQTAVPNLYFLPSGPMPADSAGLLNTQRMSDLIADVKSRFDLVLIDSPPILGVSDAAVLANEADATIIVLQHRKLPRQMLARVKQAVESVGGTVAGAVLNNVDTRSDSTYQYYTAYYSYYAPTSGGDEAVKTKKRRKRTPLATPAPAPASLAQAPSRPPENSDVF